MIFTEIAISPFFVLMLTLVWIVPVLLDFIWRAGDLRWFRVFTWTLATIGLAALYLEPYYFAEQEKVDFAVIDRNVSENTKDSLSKKGFRLLSSEDYSKTVFATAVRHLHLVGYELEPWELQQVRPDTLSYEQVDLPDGIIACAANENFVGDSLSIALSISSQQDHMLYLTSLNEVLDSIQVHSNEVKVQLKTLPKAPGKYLYKVIGKSGADTLYQEEIPVLVDAPRKLSVLMLNSYPGFESRFLKIYLAGEGYSLTVRTMVSTDISNTELINREQVFPEALSKQTLETFDLIILDPGAFQNLRSTEKNAVYQLIKQGKTGMLLINAAPGDAGEILGETISLVSSKEWNNITLNAIRASDLQPLVYQDQVIGHSQKRGIGKIAFTTLENLYKLQLKGQQELYGELLQTLLQPLLPMEEKSGFARLEAPVMVNQPMEVNFTSFADEPELYINGVRISAKESPFRPRFYTTTYWPEEEGWNTLLVLPDSLERSFYVHEQSSWKPLREHRLSAYNALAAHTFEKKDQPVFREKAFISRWLWLAVVVGCFGLLWAEQKFVNP